MHHFTVSLKVPRIVGLVVTLIAVEPFDSLVHPLDVVFQEMLMDGFVFAQMTRELLALFVDGVHVPLHVSFMAKPFSTRFTVVFSGIILNSL